MSINGSISGGGGLTKTGSGILTLTGSDSYSGGTVIAGGTLQVGNGGFGASIGSTSSVIDDGSLIINHADNLGFSDPLAATAALQSKERARSR